MLSLSAPAARLDLTSLSSNESAYAAFFYESNAFWVHLSQPGEEVCIILDGEGSQSQYSAVPLKPGVDCRLAAP